MVHCDTDYPLRQRLHLLRMPTSVSRTVDDWHVVLLANLLSVIALFPLVAS